MKSFITVVLSFGWPVRSLHADPVVSITLSLTTFFKLSYTYLAVAAYCVNSITPLPSSSLMFFTLSIVCFSLSSSVGSSESIDFITSISMLHFLMNSFFSSTSSWHFPSNSVNLPENISFGFGGFHSSSSSYISVRSPFIFGGIKYPSLMA